MEAYLPFFLVFAAVWCLQLYGTARQGKQFMREVSKLRRFGETSIGASSLQRTRRRVYVALASDESDRVTGAIELSGYTVFARAKPVEELVGRSLEELANSEDTERQALAARMAARALLGMEIEDSRPQAQRARRFHLGGGRRDTHRAVKRPATARPVTGRPASAHLPVRRT